jgi:hypothetical protein
MSELARLRRTTSNNMRAHAEPNTNEGTQATAAKGDPRRRILDWRKRGGALGTLMPLNMQPRNNKCLHLPVRPFDARRHHGWRHGDGGSRPRRTTRSCWVRHSRWHALAQARLVPTLVLPGAEVVLAEQDVHSDGSTANICRCRRAVTCPSITAAVRGLGR